MKKQKSTKLVRCYAKRWHSGANPLPASNFNMDSNKRGLFPYCKACQAYAGFIRRHGLIEIERKYADK